MLIRHLSFRARILCGETGDSIIILMEAYAMIMVMETPRLEDVKLAARRMLAVVLAAFVTAAALSVLPWEEAGRVETAPALYSVSPDSALTDATEIPEAAGTVLISRMEDDPAVPAGSAADDPGSLEQAQEPAMVQSASAAAGEEAVRNATVPEAAGPAEESAHTEETDASPAAPAPEGPVLTGSLRTDYCVGSLPDYSGVSVSAAGKETALADCLVEGWDTSSAGEKFLTVTVGEEKIRVPYGVAEYTVHLNGNGGALSAGTVSLRDYRLPEMAEPVRPGKDFAGWYRDPACTVPFESAAPGELCLELYAGWTDFPGFTCDAEGCITGYTDLRLNDGLLVLPSDAGCTGVRSGALAGLAGVWEIYIPAGITCIEPGAFGDLGEEVYVEVHPENPAYMSVNGILYTKTGEKAL